MPFTSQGVSLPEVVRATSDDQTLMNRLLDRDATALLEIYDRHSQLVFTVACHVVHNRQTAEDISQEVFLQLWNEPQSYNPERGILRTWLTVITRHRAIDYNRKHREEENLDYQNLPVDPSTNCGAYDWVDLDKVRALLQRLPIEQREVFELAYFGGLTHTEITERTGYPLGTVKSRIRLVLKNMRQTLIDVEAQTENKNRDLVRPQLKNRNLISDGRVA